MCSGKIQPKLDWDGKRTEVERVELPFQLVEVVNEPRAKTMDMFVPKIGGDKWYDMLIWGDNKLVMNSLIGRGFAGKINLIYIDPPFATGADFVKEVSGIKVKVYRDTWSQGLASYLQMIYDRLVLMRELLSEKGSIYVHMDWHAGHYVKILMDEVFGRENFKNEIVWKRYAPHSLSDMRYDIISDYILFYAKNVADTNFIVQHEQLSVEEIEKRFPYIEKETGRRYQHVALEQSSNFSSRGEVRIIQGKKVISDIGWRWTQETFDKRLSENPYLIYWTESGKPRYKIYTDEYKGRPLGNIWTDIQYLSAGDAERLGFPTQKPESLLTRIINASSNPGDLVADFFCGSGTTLAVAEKLGRRWIGADLSKFAINLSRKRLLEIPGCHPFQILNLGRYHKQKLIEDVSSD